MTCTKVWQLGHTNSNILPLGAHLPLYLLTLRSESFGGCGFLTGILFPKSIAASLYSRLCLYSLWHASQIPLIFCSRKMLSFPAFWQSSSPMSSPWQTLFIASVQWHLSDKDESMCSSHHLEPDALVKNLLDFYFELEPCMLLYYVPNIVLDFDQLPA